LFGGRLGGMHDLQWSIYYPFRVRYCVAMAAAPRLSAQHIAFYVVARQAIISDPDFHDGHFLEHDTLPRRGLKLARMVGHITYLSDDAMGQKFGRELKTEQLNFDVNNVEFQVESYLRYQVEEFSTRFDAITYLIMIEALDYFATAAAHGGNLAQTFAHVSASYYLISFTSDWRFSPERSQEIANALIAAGKDVSYVDIDAHYGH